jgi:hypothetical protein
MQPQHADHLEGQAGMGHAAEVTPPLKKRSGGGVLNCCSSQ